MFNVNGHDIKQKSNVKVLGQYVNNLKPKNGFLGYRIGQASGQFQKYKQVLCDWSVQISARIKFLEAFVRSTLLYGLVAEYPLEKDVTRITSFWYNCLREMSPGGFSVTEIDENSEETVYTYTDSDLDVYFGTPPLKDFIHANFLKYIAHVVRRDAAHPTKQALFIVPERKYAQNIFNKVKFLLPSYDITDTIYKMNDRDVFQTVLKNRFPYLQKNN